MQPVEVADVAEFFVNHAVSDNLGIIANAHLATADQADEVSNFNAWDQTPMLSRKGVQ